MPQTYKSRIHELQRRMADEAADVFLFDDPATHQGRRSGGRA
jgi:hypothetical protein